MSIHVSAKVWRIKLSPVEKLVMLKLADCAGDDGRNAYPSVATIAAEVGTSERSIQRTLRTLEAAGLIATLEKATRYKPTCYRVMPERGDKVSPLDPGRGDMGVGSGVTNDALRGDTAMAPDPSLDPSVEPSIAPTERAPGDEILKPFSPKPLTARAIEAIKSRHPPDVVDDVVNYWRGDTRFRFQQDKPAYIEAKVIQRIAQIAERRNGNANGSNRTQRNHDPDADLFSEQALRDRGIIAG